MPAVLALAVAFARRVAREVTDVAREAVWVARCLPRLVTTTVLVLLLLLWAGSSLLAGGVGAGLAGLLCWPRLDRASWHRVLDHRLTLVHRRGWITAASAVGLVVNRPTAGPGKPSRVVPRLCRGSRCRDGVSVLRLRYAGGQTIEQVERAAPALCAWWGAHSAQVREAGPSHAIITLALRDVLCWTTHTPPPPPIVPGAHPLAGVELGRAMSGQPWRANARVHTLVAGATGAGKGSVMWSLLAGVAPAVRAGTVRLVGVDLKAGMELLHGKDLFSTLATTPEQAVAVLEREAKLMTGRADRMAGQHRTHTPTTTDPHVLIVIDELAAVTAYITDRDLSRRADAALRLLLSQGRAPGVSVWAWVQDPRKDTVPMRNLFPNKIGLRLADAFEAEVIMGEGSIKTAPCHRIRDNVPGTGYALSHDDGRAVKVRAHYATDDFIHWLNDTYPSLHRLPIPELVLSVNPLLRNISRATPAANTEPTDNETDNDTGAGNAGGDARAVDSATGDGDSVDGVRGSLDDELAAWKQARQPRQRAPRKPRQPRVPRPSRAPRAGESS